MRSQTTIFLSMLCIAAATPALGQGTWHADGTGIVGFAGSGNNLCMVLDGNAEGHMLMAPINWASLTYRHWTEIGWETLPAISGFDNLTSEFGASLALDADGRPHFAFVNKEWLPTWPYCLKYGFWNGSAWEVEYLSDTVGTCVNPSLVLTQGDLPRIAYYHAVGSFIYLCYAEQNGGSWSFDTLAVMNTASYPTRFRCPLVLDAGGNPHIAFWDDNTLAYARRIGGSWTIETVDADGPTGFMASLALTSSGQPRIAYRCGGTAPYEFRYASREGSSWTVESVGMTSGPIELALNGQDRPRLVAAVGSPAYELVYMVWNGSAWEYYNPGYSIVPDMSSCPGVRIPLHLDSFDRPYIAAIPAAGENDPTLIWLNMPPDPFDLLGPADGASVTSTPTLSWEAADIRVAYDIWYALDPDFDPHWEFTDLEDTTFQFTSGYLCPGGTYYWKVLARDDFDDYETWSTAPGGGGGGTYWTMNVYPTGNEESQFEPVPAWELSTVQNPSTGGMISLRLLTPQSGPVLLRVHDISGRVVAERTVQAATGLQEVLFTDLHAGIFLCTVEAPGYSGIVRTVVID